MRAELLHKESERQNFHLHVFVQFEELQLKLIADLNNPTHFRSMTYKTYDVNYISLVPVLSSLSGRTTLCLSIVTSSLPRDGVI